MNLDNIDKFRQLDAGDMLGHIQSLPDQLEKAWQSGIKQPLPVMAGIERVLIAGMGGSAIGADLLAAFISPTCSVPVQVLREYDLPAWAAGQKTLVITSSHSGNTEETLAVFDQAHQRNCLLLAITRGGNLAKKAEAADVPLWTFEHSGQPRSAPGYGFALPLAALYRLGLVPDAASSISRAAKAMREQEKSLLPEIPAVKNPAKRMAGQMVNRWVMVISSGYLAPISRRWKGQISELAKAWAQFETLPEVDHNTLAGLDNPSGLLHQTSVVFLSTSSDHPRNRKRAELTRQSFMLEGLNTDLVEIVGATPLEQMWTALHLGDYVAYYLAMAYGVDPTPIPAIEGFKKSMNA